MMNSHIDLFASHAKHQVHTSVTQSVQVLTPGKLLTSLAKISVMMPLLLATSLHASERTIQPAKLAIDRQGIKVWTYQTAGNPSFNYRATTILNSSLSAAAALIISPEDAPQWAPYVHHIDVISPPDAAGVTVFRMELDLPFPLQDRDVVVKAQLSQAEDGSVMLKSEAIKDARAPERAGIVRVTRYQGSWFIRALSKGQVEVTTAGYADLGGAVPLSFANMFVQQQPYQMLRNMRSYIQQPEFQNIALANIQEP
jgi:hypothetical protein